MFEAIGGLLTTLFGDITSTFVTLFAIGILVCALGAAFGGDENQGKFKRGLITCIICLVAFLLAGKIVEYFQKNVKGGTTTTFIQTVDKHHLGQKNTEDL